MGVLIFVFYLQTSFILRNEEVYCSYVYIGNKSSLNNIKYALETEEKYVNECEGSRRVNMVQITVNLK